ncbi:MAG TPA: acyltransferase [Solirubrobacteraceae bacterium]|nr:acyltransferase [Solirubrobacteraceae bacterium]
MAGAASSDGRAETGDAPAAAAPAAGAPGDAAELARRARLWARKWRWYERNTLPWNRARIHWELLRREAFVRWPVHGNVLEALREGRLEIGAGALLEPGVWITAPGDARVRIGAGTFLNKGVMVAAQELVEIGDHCMLANGCFVSDASHRYDDLEQPITWQGFESKGPTRIGENCWLGANVVVTSGVQVGERCVIGANSVVTHEIPAFSIAAGAPARVIRHIDRARAKDATKVAGASR